MHTGVRKNRFNRSIRSYKISPIFLLRKACYTISWEFPADSPANFLLHYAYESALHALPNRIMIGSILKIRVCGEIYLIEEEINESFIRVSKLYKYKYKSAETRPRFVKLIGDKAPFDI